MKESSETMNKRDKVIYNKAIKDMLTFLDKRSII